MTQATIAGFNGEGRFGCRGVPKTMVFWGGICQQFLPDSRVPGLDARKKKPKQLTVPSTKEHIVLKWMCNVVLNENGTSATFYAPTDGTDGQKFGTITTVSTKSKGSVALMHFCSKTMIHFLPMPPPSDATRIHTQNARAGQALLSAGPQ
jgi:hypothetical protein